MRRARSVSVLLACGLVVVGAFQVALVSGAPWGAAAYGGSRTGVLPDDLRVVSVFAAAFWLLAAVVVLTRGGITGWPVRHAVGQLPVRVLSAVLVVGGVLNSASSSDWERFGWAPFVLLLSLLSLQLARTPLEAAASTPREGASSGPSADPRAAARAVARQEASSRPTGSEGTQMDVQGIVFAGTGTSARSQMSTFVRDVLGLLPTQVAGVEADLFNLPDGSSFAVASAGGMGETDRSIGFLVGDIEAAICELRAAGSEVDEEVSGNARERYVHFRAPDGHLYELVERRPGPSHGMPAL